MIKEITLYFFLLNILSNNLTCAAATHKHVLVSSKERPEDGVYSPRDAHHHENGAHHTEFDHEAILGSVKEAEEYDTLSPEESKRRLGVLVRNMDLNKDEYVDRHELKAWILRSFKMLSEEEATERFEDIDSNHDGNVSWIEYLQDVYGIEDENGNKDVLNPSSDEEQKLMQDDKEMFAAADLNGDRVLDPHEFELFQSPEEHPHMLPIILKQTLRDKDSNSDGSIDFKEFLGENTQDHDKQWLVVEKEKFDEYDKDKDSVLSGNEILSWIVPSNDEVASDEVEHLFASADDNHDDRLSYSEVIEHYDTFVGSEATDYGDHLQNIHHFDDEL